MSRRSPYRPAVDDGDEDRPRRGQGAARGPVSAALSGASWRVVAQKVRDVPHYM